MDRRVKALITRAAVLALIAGILLAVVARGTPCLFRKLTGVLCPTCGMSRAWLSFFRLDLAAAFHFHPMFWAIPVLGLTYLLEGFAFPGKRCTKALYLLILAGFAVTYFIRLVCFLSGNGAV